MRTLHGLSGMTIDLTELKPKTAAARLLIAAVGEMTLKQAADLWGVPYISLYRVIALGQPLGTKAMTTLEQVPALAGLRQAVAEDLLGGVA